MPDFRFENALKNKSIVVHVAICGLIRALRPFIHRPAVSFVAVLKVPVDENLETYRIAAEYLLRLPVGGTLNDFREEAQTSVEAFGDFADAVNLRRAQSMKYERRAVVLYCGSGEVPGQLLMAADVVSEIEPPVASHYLATAKSTGLQGMTEADAAFLCGCAFYDIKLAFRSGRPLANGLRRLKALSIQAAVDEVVDAAPAAAPTERRLEDAVGYGEARDWGLRVAEDLRAWSAGGISWADVDRGALLAGPPGSGKTTYSAMLAATCGATLVTASAAKWQAAGHLGDMLKAMRASFEEAMREAPSILFIDEFDSLGSRDDDDGQNSNYNRQVVNAMLELLDGAAGHEGVVVLGATNYPQRVDAGLLRPGRLETHLVIPQLDSRARLAVLRRHVGIDDLEFDGDGFAAATEGWTGAQVEKLARDARRLARTARRAVKASDIVGLLPERIPVPEALLERLAVHELGHALVGVLVGQDLVCVEITDAQFSGGIASVGRAEFRKPRMSARTRTDFLNEIACLLGGLAAEIVVFGEHSDGAAGAAYSDLARATHIATLIEVHWAMAGAMVSEAADDSRRLEMLRTDPNRWARIDATIREQLERAKAFVEERTDVLIELKDMLLERKRLDADVVVDRLAINRSTSR
jgi:cell division protease FtsH